MGGITSTSWGLLIAYVLPGLVGLYGASLWSRPVSKLFSAFLTLNSSVGLFFLDILAAIAIGLLVAAVRWVLIDTSLRRLFRKERILFRIKIKNRVFFTARSPQLDSRFGPLYERLVETNKLVVYRFFIDEVYRYYQWWGGFVIVLLPVLSGWIRYLNHSAAPGWVALASFGALVLEGFIVLKVVDSHIETVRIGKAILRGGSGGASEEEEHSQEEEPSQEEQG